MGKITTSSIYSVLSEKLRICINLKLSRLESRFNLDLGKKFPGYGSESKSTIPRHEV